MRMRKMIKKKETTTRTSAKFFKGHENTVIINGYNPSANDKFKNYEDELREREKLRALLRRAKAAGNTEMVKELETELNINTDEQDQDNDRVKKIDEAIAEYHKLLQNTDLDEKIANRYWMIINSLNMQRPGSSKSVNQFLPQANMLYPPRSTEPNQNAQLQTLMFDFMKTMIENKKGEQLSPMEQYEKFDDMISKRMPSLKEQIEEMREMMKLTGNFVDGNTSLEQLRLKADMDKTDKDFNYKKLELDLKKENNAAIMNLGSELASAIITGAVESLTSDDEDTQEVETKTILKPNNNIHLTEQQKSNNEWFLDCKRCEVSFKITDLDKPREVACTKCGWPHYFYHKKDGKYGYVGPDPNGKMIQGDPDKWLENYQPGMLEKSWKIELERLKQENDKTTK